MSDTSTLFHATADVLLDAVPAVSDDESGTELVQHEFRVLGDRLIEVGAVRVSRDPMTGHVNVDASTLTQASVFAIGFLAGRLADISGVPVDAVLADVRQAVANTHKS